MSSREGPYHIAAYAASQLKHIHAVASNLYLKNILYIAFMTLNIELLDLRNIPARSVGLFNIVIDVQL